MLVLPKTKPQPYCETTVIEELRQILRLGPATNGAKTKLRSLQCGKKHDEQTVTAVQAMLSQQERRPYTSFPPEEVTLMVCMLSSFLKTQFRKEVQALRKEFGSLSSSVPHEKLFSRFEESFVRMFETPNKSYDDGEVPKHVLRRSQLRGLTRHAVAFTECRVSPLS